MDFAARLVLAFLVVSSLGPVGTAVHPPQQASTVATLRVPILMYHYISVNPHWPADPLRTRLSVPPRQFAQQLAYIHKAGFTTITLDDLFAALQGSISLPLKPVVLTFDDGYEDFYTNAYPLLQQYDYHATIFVISQKVGTPGYLTWEELQELAASPLITIGAHTRTHPNLTALSPERSWEELAGSKTDLEGQLGITVNHLAYPAGRYNDRIVQQAQQIGFLTAVTTREGSLQRADQVLALRRIRVNGGASLADLIAGLTGTRGVPRQPPPLPRRSTMHAGADPSSGRFGTITS